MQLYPQLSYACCALPLNGPVVTLERVREEKKTREWTLYEKLEAAGGSGDMDEAGDVQCNARACLGCVAAEVESLLHGFKARSLDAFALFGGTVTLPLIKLPTVS